MKRAQKPNMEAVFPASLPQKQPVHGFEGFRLRKRGRLMGDGSGLGLRVGLHVDRGRVAFGGRRRGNLNSQKNFNLRHMRQRHIENFE
jgi:hypothetical protein